MSVDSGTPTAIELLILSGSLDETERFVTSLRNGGLAVHGRRIHDMDTLEDALLGNAWDMILCCDYDPHIDLTRVMQLHGELDKDIPVLVLYDGNAEPARLLEAMSRGARDLVQMDNPTLLQLVVAREFGDLQARRELKILRRRLEETEQRCTGLIDSSQEPIAYFQDGMHVHVNAAYLRLFGFEIQADVEDLPLLDMVDKAHHRALRAALKQLEGEPERKPLTLEVTCRRNDGSTFDATLALSRATMDGEPSVQVMVRSAAETARVVEERIQQPTNLTIDTDLPNRQHFMGKLSEWLAARDQSSEVPALLFVSLDSFRELRNAGDVSGADALTKAIGNILRDTVGSDDLLARFGDNTFTVLCRRASADRISELAEALRSRIAGYRAEGVDTAITASVGIALLTDAGEDPEDAVNHAYSACEAARAEGGNGVAIHDSSPLPPALQANPQDAKILDLITRGLTKDRYRLLYQPIVSLQGDTRENYSVLVRLLDADGGELLPEFFLKQAEQWGRMGEIDRWIIRNAIASLSRQRREGRKVNFFVTLSEASLTDRNLLLWICDCLREYQARGGWLTFQIREHLARAHVSDTLRLIDGLKKIKCQIALDHFGNQPDPQTLLDKLSVDFLKLAPDFARELTSNPKKQEALSALNELAQARGLKTIATAVEDANSLTVLWTVGVSYIQGYFLQEPSETIEYSTAQLA